MVLFLKQLLSQKVTVVFFVTHDLITPFMYVNMQHNGKEAFMSHKRKNYNINAEFNLIKNEISTTGMLNQTTNIIVKLCDINIFEAYYIWRYTIGKCISNGLVSKKEFKVFLLKSLKKFVECTTIDNILLMLVSLEEYEQTLVGHFFINPYNDDNFAYQFIEFSIKEKQFDFEMELVDYIRKYNKQITKSIFDLDIFLEHIINIHLKNNSVDFSLKEKNNIEIFINLLKEFCDTRFEMVRKS